VATTTTSATAASTTSTTLPLSGRYEFEDRRRHNQNTTVHGVDTERGLMCTAGQLQAADGEVRVVFTYEALGDIYVATSRKVKARAASARLTLEISGGGVAPYLGTIETECRLLASLRGRGERDRAILHCELGAGFAAFPGLDGEQVATLHAAFARARRAWAKVENGRLRLAHYGVPTDDAGLPPCELPDPE
jgi:hypothetical protein